MCIRDRNNTIKLSTDTFVAHGWIVHRLVSPEFPIIFRVHGSHGETPEQLAQILRSKKIAMLSSENLFYEYGKKNMDEFIGHDFSSDRLDTISLLGT